MPTNIDETELARLEALAGKASLLPWANTDTAKELLNVEPDDWWKIYASNGPEETRFPYHVVCSMSQRATDEEMTAARKAYFYPDGDHIMRDPGKSGHNARYIAAACNAVPALVAEVRRLRENVEAWEWLEECFDNCKQRGKLPLELHKTPSAYSEAWASLWAALEAHADRE